MKNIVLIPFISGVAITISVAFTSNVKDVLQIKPASPRSIIIKEYYNFEKLKPDLINYYAKGYVIKSLTEDTYAGHSYTLIMEKY